MPRELHVSHKLETGSRKAAVCFRSTCRRHFSMWAECGRDYIMVDENVTVILVGPFSSKMELAMLSDELGAATEALYSTFAPYPLHEVIEGCPCCIADTDQARIRSKPLRELTAEDLSVFASHVPHLWGEADDLKHFLPRILELLPEWMHMWPDPEVVGASLRRSEFQNWPEAERKVVQDYLFVWWKSFIASESVFDINTAICAVGQVIDDLSPFLAIWNPSPNFDVCNAFWDERHEQMGQVVRWVSARAKA